MIAATQHPPIQLWEIPYTMLRVLVGSPAVLTSLVLVAAVSILVARCDR